ncbi:ribbon-helix-helix domain-containing protein [Bosea sp. NPDC003192]|jgi:predicted DNA-binding ribbon-helix-helix protein|uniref:ribbon-helix-helix domain-containing protein n=1 Tax=unclassified Bosea (in: a-proteobacteria) TaxID=2653178 RepID=UPI002DDC9707|nr:ribbon-helix-helix domain-containing protein [Bosea sp. (in: a-proteobacteria)]HEV2509475.1 ribbon-helix-helix domain-containing protein [Bosea sp. (in: a-proteobacteria)]
MCRIFSAQTADRYAYQTRSIRLGGHATSIRLEAAFWDILEEIALMQGVTLGRFLSKLHDEVLEFQEETMNFTSLLRCACLTYLSDVRGQEEDSERLRRDAVQAFHTAAE